MPRRSSGRSSGGGSSWSARRPAASTPNPAPARAPAPPPAPMSTPSRGGLGSAVAEGLAFGGGNAIAHRAVDSLLGPRTIRHETVADSAPAAQATTMGTAGGPDACVVQSKAFQDCVSYHASDISKCQFYLDMLSECRRSSGAGLSI